MRPGYLILTLLLATACSFDLGFDGTRYQCGEGDRCPAGQSCVAGVCTADPDADVADDGPTTDASDPGDAIGPDGPPPAAVCGNLSLLTDTFEVAGDGPFWNAFNDSGAAVTETGGELVVDLPANADVYAGYIGNNLYDLHGGAAETQVDQVTGANTILEVRNYLGNAVQLLHKDGMIKAATLNVAGAGTLAERAWNPAEKYWRIREENGDVVWEVSTDRASWSLLHRRVAPFDIDHVRAAVSGGGSAPAASRARFEDVNLAGSSIGFCPGDQLRDDFAATPLAPTWQPYTVTGCTVNESGGNLVMSYTAVNNNAFCGLTANHLWDMSAGDGLTIDGSVFPDRPNFVSYLQAVSPADAGTRVEITVDGTLLEARTFVNELQQNSRSVTNNRIIHKWWRLRGQGNTAIIETSPDRTTWNEFTRFALTWDFSVAELGIGAGNYGPTTAVTINVPGINAD